MCSIHPSSMWWYIPVWFMPISETLPQFLETCWSFSYYRFHEWNCPQFFMVITERRHSSLTSYCNDVWWHLNSTVLLWRWKSPKRELYCHNTIHLVLLQYSPRFHFRLSPHGTVTYCYGACFCQVISYTPQHRHSNKHHCPICQLFIWRFNIGAILKWG
jgi:hypothetical protein